MPKQGPTPGITVFDYLVRTLGGGQIMRLAQVLKVSRQTLYQWRKAGYIPESTSYDVVMRAAKMTGITGEVLTGRVRFATPKEDGNGPD